MFSAFLLIAAATVVVGLLYGNQADQATEAVRTVQDRVTTVQSDASVAKNKATDAARSNEATKVTADRANARSKGTVRFLQGKQGSPGITGVDGRIGAAGSPGARGLRGLRGPAGAPGVFPLADFLSRFPALLTTACNGSCVGPAGARGDQGPQGDTGAKGEPGADGAAGVAGPPGADGAQGPAGPTGATGADGATGPAGPAGADGVTTTIVVVCPAGVANPPPCP